jgi:hypothetical protein
MLSANWPAVKRVAAGLLGFGQLDGDMANTSLVGEPLR